MKKLFLVFTAVILLSITASAQLSGPLSGTLGPGTYTVIGHIWVSNGDFLTIEAGATLIFNEGVQFDIDGYLHAAGTETDSIKFINSPDLTWGGIDFNDSANDSSRLEYCLITGGYASEEHPEGRGGGILCDESSPTISNCFIIENVADWLGGGIYCYYSSPTIENCVIKHNLAGCYYGGNGGGICCYYSAPTIKNCTIEDNIADSWGNGGGIYCYGSSYSPTIDSCTIRGNIADKYGGGIFCDNSPTISNCTISGNSTVCDNGGGITCIGSGSSPTIENCTISDNSAMGDCGGIYCIDSSPNITNCVISGNSTNFHGGGIYCISSSPTISYCTISGNAAGMDGGGIRCLNSSPIISNCVISRNSATWYGGGFYCLNSSPQITNCVISGNSTNIHGGGISCYNSSPTIENCTISGNSAVEGGGLRIYSSSPTIVNTIVEGNTGQYGVYFDNSPNASLTYSDFYNNENGNFYNPPAYLGQIITVNANGDSCDLYMNIFEYPLFYSTTGDSAYYLTFGSPCIDAGDPSYPLDPDSTIADIGAFYFDQSQIPSITVTLIPYNPPIQIPANGGTFDFNISVENQGVLPVIVDIWTMATLPNGNEYGPIIGPLNLALAPGFSANRDRTQNVPGNAPAGNYTYDAYVGIYPNTVWAEDHFDFEKLTVSEEGYLETVENWICTGEPFLNEASTSVHPPSFILHPSNPNPFNPETTISFELRDASMVKLVIYDIQGREVARLVDAFMMAGVYQRTFDGSKLASGVYFAFLKAEGFSQMRKLLLIK